MNDKSTLDAIEPGMTVIGVDGETIGTVESVRSTSIRVADHEIPHEAIGEVTDQGVILLIAKTALMARRDPDIEGISSADAAMTISDDDSKLRS